MLKWVTWWFFFVWFKPCLLQTRLLWLIFEKTSSYIIDNHSNRLNARIIFKEIRYSSKNSASLQNAFTGALVALVANNHCEHEYSRGTEMVKYNISIILKQIYLLKWLSTIPFKSTIEIETLHISTWWKSSIISENQLSNKLRSASAFGTELVRNRRCLETSVALTEKR